MIIFLTFEENVEAALATMSERNMIVNLLGALLQYNIII